MFLGSLAVAAGSSPNEALTPLALMLKSEELEPANQVRKRSFRSIFPVDGSESVANGAKSEVTARVSESRRANTWLNKQPKTFKVRGQK